MKVDFPRVLATIAWGSPATERSNVAEPRLSRTLGQAQSHETKFPHGCAKRAPPARARGGWGGGEADYGRGSSGGEKSPSPAIHSSGIGLGQPSRESGSASCTPLAIRARRRDPMHIGV